jgi:hypothetical protein
MPWLKSMTGKGLKRTLTFLARWANLAVLGANASGICSDYDTSVIDTHLQNQLITMLFGRS